MKKVFFTADTHFGHANIIKYCNRPFMTVEEMNNEMIKRWNSVVEKDDIVYHLGDLAFLKYCDITNKLNGSIFLIRGNHDKYTDNKLMSLGICKVYHKSTIVNVYGRDIHLMHAPKDYKNGIINLCGHIHEIAKWSNNILNVGVDIWNFTPVEYSQIISEFEEKLK